MESQIIAQFERPHTPSQARSLLEPNMEDFRTRLVTVPYPETTKWRSDSHPDLGYSWQLLELAGPNKDTVRLLCDGSLRLPNKRISEHESIVRVTDTIVHELDKGDYNTPSITRLLED